jgi:hypothetical protein
MNDEKLKILQNSFSIFVFPFYNFNLCSRSSVDRVFPSEGKGRRFNSYREYSFFIHHFVILNRPAQKANEIKNLSNIFSFNGIPCLRFLG